jgi:DNA-directed RNA polymerase specialized sigma24 family protein
LPDRQREAVVLRVWGGLTLQQIATTMGVAVSTVHDDLARAMALMRGTTETPDKP